VLVSDSKMKIFSKGALAAIFWGGFRPVLIRPMFYGSDQLFSSKLGASRTGAKYHHENIACACDSTREQNIAGASDWRAFTGHTCDGRVRDRRTGTWCSGDWSIGDWSRQNPPAGN